MGEEDDSTADSGTFQTHVEGHHCMNWMDKGLYVCLDISNLRDDHIRLPVPASLH